MSCYLKYIRDIFIHKWEVIKVGVKLGVPIWNLFIHDLSKFRPSEFIGYMNWTYRRDKYPEYPYLSVGEHQKRNPHHWQYYIFLTEESKEVVLEIPEVFVMEMVADWAACSKKPGRKGIRDWWDSKKDIIKIHERSRELITKIINENFTL